MSSYGDIIAGLRKNKDNVEINEVAITLNADKFWNVVNNQYDGDYVKMMMDKYNYKVDPKYPVVLKRGGFDLERDKIKAKKTKICQFMLDFDVQFKNKDIGKKYLIPDSDGTWVDLDGDGVPDFKTDKSGKVTDIDMSDNQDDIQRARDNLNGKKVVGIKRRNPLEGSITFLDTKLDFKIADKEITDNLVFDVYKGSTRTGYVCALSKGVVDYKTFDRALSAIEEDLSDNCNYFVDKVFGVDVRSFYECFHNGIKGRIYFSGTNRFTKLPNNKDYGLKYQISFSIPYEVSKNLDLPTGSLATSYDNYITNISQMDEKYFTEQFVNLLESRGIGGLVINDSFKKVMKTSEDKLKKKSHNFAIPITRKMRTMINKEKTFTCIYDDSKFSQAFAKADKIFKVKSDTKFRAFKDYTVAKAYSGALSKSLGKDVGEVIIANFFDSIFDKSKGKYSIVYTLEDEAGIRFDKMYGALEVDASFFKDEEVDIDKLLKFNLKSFKLISEGTLQSVNMDGIDEDVQDIFLDTMLDILSEYPNYGLRELRGEYRTDNSLAVCRTYAVKGKSSWNGKAISTIALNTKVFDNISKIVPGWSSASKSRGHVWITAEYFDTQKEYIDAIIRHEFGHSIHFMLFASITDENSPALIPMQRFMDLVLGMDKDVLKNSVSEYALSEIKSYDCYREYKYGERTAIIAMRAVECFAECYALMGTVNEGRLPDGVADVMRELIDIAKSIEVEKDKVD